jgi:hypothetical protein
MKRWGVWFVLQHRRSFCAAVVLMDRVRKWSGFIWRYWVAYVFAGDGVQKRVSRSGEAAAY